MVSDGQGFGRGLSVSSHFLVAQKVKRLPAMWETWVQSLGREDPPEKEMATHSSNSCLENSMDEGTWWATIRGVTKSQTRLSDFTFFLSISIFELALHCNLKPFY